jgi:uncharacterized protein YdeI (YjbR/CyaY-like superfamily)
MNPKVDNYLDNVEKWQPELELLRWIILNCGLKEDFKWKHPCYTYKGANVLLIHEFKEYCAVSFFKGVLLNDTENLLIQPTKNMQAGRQIRFVNTIEIRKVAVQIKSYIFQAIEIEILGRKVQMKDTVDFEIPNELLSIFLENPELKRAFEKLTPGRQRGYILYFSQPKQAKTRVSRITKYSDRILDGKGLNDCVCGLSKRLPNCDGSHNQREN